MPEQFLDDPDIGAVVKQVGSTAVAQDVRAEPPLQANPLPVEPHDPPRALAREATPAYV
jgi:hypothetical protein